MAAHVETHLLFVEEDGTHGVAGAPKLGDHYSTHQSNFFVRTLAGRVATRKYNGFSST